jgi:hypothetical protein
MSVFHKASLSVILAAQCLFAGLAAPAQAQTAQVPNYFFNTWTVAKNCTEAHAGLAARADTGLKFKIVRGDSDEGSYVFQALDNGKSKWAAQWNGLELQYRPGSKLTSVPADFECIPGQEATSSFLAMSGYAQSAEPYYGQEHWYTQAKIHGQLEHVLIFPRDASAGGPSAIIVLQSVNAPDTVQLDENGVIHAQ